MSHESEIATGLRYTKESKNCAEYFYRKGEASEDCRFIALECSSIKRGNFFSDYFSQKLSHYSYKVTSALVGKPVDHIDSITAPRHIVSVTRKVAADANYNCEILYKSADYDNDLFLHLGTKPFPDKHVLPYKTMPCKLETKSSLIYSIHKLDGMRFRAQAVKPALHHVMVCPIVLPRKVKWFYTTSENVLQWLDISNARPKGKKKNQCDDFVLGENIRDEFDITYNENGEFVHDPKTQLDYKQYHGYDDMIPLDLDDMQSVGRFVKFCAGTMQWNGKTKWQKVLNRVADSMTNIKVMA